LIIASKTAAALWSCTVTWLVISLHVDDGVAHREHQIPDRSTLVLTRCRRRCGARHLRHLVDSSPPPHYVDFMNLHVPPELEARLARLTAETGRRADQLALDLLASSVNHDGWFRQEVEKGRESARAGRLLDHDAVVSRINRRYDA
jgi:predicted transcriptional regulator